MKNSIKKSVPLLLSGLALSAWLSAAHAQVSFHDSEAVSQEAVPQVMVPQIDPDSVFVRDKERTLIKKTPTQIRNKESSQNQPQDYQDQVLSDPAISDYARYQAMIKNSWNENNGGGANQGGNVAVIEQQGDGNVSTIRQDGDHNQAKQLQQGRYNLLTIDQNGNDNRSEESQIGDYNIKIKRQNGISTIE